MQMYLVTFQTHFENCVDKGKVIVGANSPDDAVDRLLNLLELPRSRTQFDIVKIKPSLWELERKEIYKPKEKPRPAHEEDSQPLRQPIAAVMPPDEIPAVPLRIHRELRRFKCIVSALVEAGDERRAIYRLGESLVERSSGRTTSVAKALSGILVDCVEVTGRRELKRLESVELYRGKNLVGR